MVTFSNEVLSSWLLATSCKWPDLTTGEEARSDANVCGMSASFWLSSSLGISSSSDGNRGVGTGGGILSLLPSWSSSSVACSLGAEAAFFMLWYCLLSRFLRITSGSTVEYSANFWSSCNAACNRTLEVLCKASVDCTCDSPVATRM